MQAKNKKNFGSLVNPRGLNFSSRKQVGGVSLLFKLKLNEFHFCAQYCHVFIMDKISYGKYKYKKS